MTLPAELTEWAQRHGVAAVAFAELSAMLGVRYSPAEGDGSEARAQSEIRLAAPQYGLTLWRNNVGVLPDARGIPVRFGLANDSPQLNKRLKSADLVGWRRLEIGPQHVGRQVAQFVSYEVKHPGWVYTGADRELAQARWASLVTAAGGIGRFITSAEELPK